ncbi:(Fe-S)-binding protein [Indioceanicola profundi]|uniref:(Fe-S)-binding protein n=1 Tax=Indioceanicola profundi TaxID=2220096 RepID=UPI000E6AA0D0|nr:(Fe-S)-binding protein [Indioceanicola profundi]
MEVRDQSALRREQADGQSGRPAGRAPKVGLLVTCLVDLFRPSVGFAAVKLLEDAGCEVVVPRQTCCGQPAWNAGDRATTEALAKAMIEAFEGCDYVVGPSGSCTGMMRLHYQELFKDDADWALRAHHLSRRTHELVSFLTDIMGVEKVDAAYQGTVTYHDSCAGLREMGVKAQPRKLLAGVEGLKLAELPEAEVCCGFGGTFCVKYPEISTKMVSDKAGNIQSTGADMLLAGDMGCLMNMAGRLQRLGSTVKVRHVAEVLAGDLSAPPIGESEEKK